MIEGYRGLFDFIRIVDPKAKKALTIGEDGMIYGDVDCYSFWKTNEMCVDCIAKRAIKEKNTLVKIQYDMERMYILFATPVMIDGKILAKELIKDVTNDLIFETIDKEHEHEVRNIIQDINSLLILDSLTNLYNRRYINQMLPVELERNSDYTKHISIAMVDIDGFKKINDTYGHYAGDMVLKNFSDTMTKYIRNDRDWIARYGGDEFLICLHNVDSKEAEKILERLRKAIEDMTVEVENKVIKVTASFGLITVKDTGLKPDELIKLADNKLYEAKKQGRNRVVS